MIIKKILAACAWLLPLTSLVSAEPFKIEDIQLEGLERIEPGTVFTRMPVRVGDVFTDRDSVIVIRELYKTGFFKDISLGRDGNVLLVVLQERPGIASIDIKGNKDIEEEALIEGLQAIGIAPGRVFNRSYLERLENELLQQYFASGKYSVQIQTNITDVGSNRVAIEILISEGKVAKIKDINIVGNTVFKEKELKKEFESGQPPFYAFWSSRDQYAKQKLAADLETLRSQYLDQGYLKFSVRSTQVSISEDKRDIFITINIDEGDQYVVEEVKLAGTFVVPEEELQELLQIVPGEIFSRGRVVASTEAISNRLGSEGYAFARINPVPEINEEARTVDLTLFIDPGQRVYVRRINIKGNDASRDEVFRRELRQMEGGWYSQAAVEASRARIQRLAFVESVELETVRIPGIDDFVDIDIVVEERLAGSFSIGAGLSDSQGAVVTSSVSQDNFLGTGKEVAFSINTSRVNTVYSLAYNDPYYTIDGVSRGFAFNFISTDAEEADISDFDSDRYGFTLRYGIPLTEVDRIGFSGGVQRTVIGTSVNTPDEVFEFLEDNDNKYLNFLFNSSFTHDTRNRRVFGTRGNYQRLAAEVALPGSDLEFFKLSYENVLLIPLTDIFTFSVRGEVGYGDSYGSTTDLPFFENFRAGGTNSVRGFRANSLGPQDSFDDPFGGSFLTTGSVELFFPPPLFDQQNLRLGLFVDVGNVFEDYGDFEYDELRGGAGLGVNWITGLGGISFSFASAFNDDENDETEVFQFNFGTSF